jgi:predicted unusual protein kinase regulating ubiquinone biosynthesis (AarF/ABC1/UbiB family)
MTKKQQTPVPSTRIGRFAKVVKLAGGVAGGMVAEGSRRLRDGERIRARELLLTPANARRLTRELSNMRGAAMKLGQILSMDTGEFLPRELTEILSKLRSDADSMPPRQLNQAMSQAYGDDWEELFYGFEFKPIAAASIGQVHKAYAPDGREIALKIQYPGVARSIDSDVNNIASLLRVSGLLPQGIDIQPLLDEAKIQLRDEANYLSEAEHLKAFSEALAGDSRFQVPEVLPELTRENVLVMTHVDSEPIELIAELDQTERDRVITALIDLMLQEFFALRMVQTDPNFANFRYRRSDRKIVLLDFGATRYFKATFVSNYKRLVRAAMRGDDKRLLAAAEKVGYIVAGANEEYRAFVLEVFKLALEPLVYEGAYDFGNSDLSSRLAVLGESAQNFREFWQAPPADAVFFHRKVGGMFMLAHRMKARVNIRELAQKWL